jgi:hypothetical protein
VQLRKGKVGSLQLRINKGCLDFPPEAGHLP